MPRPTGRITHWARGVQVFANASAQRATGDETASFSGYQPRVYNWGISLTRPAFNVRMNWNYRGPRRTAPIAPSPRSIEGGSFNWIGNLANAFEDVERHGPNTPAYARIFSRYDYAQLWTVGMKGSF